MGNICFSTGRVHVEAWHNGTRCTTAAVAVFGLHGAVGKCLSYLREWSGEEPSIERELQAAMDAADNLLIQLACNGYR